MLVRNPQFGFVANASCVYIEKAIEWGIMMLKRAGLLVALVVGLLLPAMPGWSQTVTVTQANTRAATGLLNSVFSRGASGGFDAVANVKSGLVDQSLVLAERMARVSPGEQVAVVEALAKAAATNPEFAVVLANVLKASPALSAVVAQGLATAGNATVVAQVTVIAQSLGVNTTTLTSSIQSQNPTLATQAAALADSQAVVSVLTLAKTVDTAGQRTAITQNFTSPVNQAQAGSGH